MRFPFHFPCILTRIPFMHCSLLLRALKKTTNQFYVSCESICCTLTVDNKALINYIEYTIRHIFRTGVIAMKAAFKLKPFFRIIQSFFTTWTLMKAGRMEPGNILTLVFFLLVLLFYRHTDDTLAHYNLDNKKGLYQTSAILSFVFTVLYMAVDAPRYIETLTSPLFRFGILAAVFFGFIFLFYHLLEFLFLFTTDKLRLSQLLLSDKYSSCFEKRSIKSFYIHHPGLCAFILCMLCWLPYFLYQYPGIMTPDSIVQFEQVLGVNPYSNHHPWIHTLLFKLFYSIGYKLTGSMLIGVSFYTFSQMCILAWSASYFISTLKIFRIRPAILMLFTSFYALIPYHGVYSVTLWKDIPFAAAVLCFGCASIRLERKISSSIKTNAGNLVLYLLSGIMLCLFRSNGWYAFILSLPFLLAYFRKSAKVMFPVLLGIFGISLIVKIPVMNTFSVTQPDLIESLSIPAQQISAVLCNDRNLKPEELELIENVVVLTYIKELYNPFFADNIKELVRAGNQSYLEDHKSDFFKLWIDLGLRYPGDYLTAYIRQTYGYWYPDSFYPVADAEGVSATSLGVSHTPLIRGPLVVKGKEIALKLGGMVPLYGTLWSMGIGCWILLFSIGNVIIRREKNKLILYLPSAALLLTVLIATPVATEFRYVYFLMFALPFYLITSLMPFSES